MKQIDYTCIVCPQSCDITLVDEEGKITVSFAFLLKSPHIAEYIKNADDLVGFQIISNLGLKYMQENAMEAMKVFMNR